MANLVVDVVAADRKVWSGEATIVVAPAADGEIGVLPGHSPVLSVLQSGEFRITPVSGAPVTGRVGGGFLSVDANRVTIVADSIAMSTDAPTR